MSLHKDLLLKLGAVLLTPNKAFEKFKNSKCLQLHMKKIRVRCEVFNFSRIFKTVGEMEKSNLGRRDF